jgi:hypothetical protein
LALARSQLLEALFHLLQTAYLALIHGLIEASAMQNFHTQRDIRTIAAHCRIAKRLLVWPNVAARGPLFLGKNPISDGMQGGVHSSARRASWADLFRSRFGSASQLNFESDLARFTPTIKYSGQTSQQT